jgi:aminoglycoside 6'-N-acetyltransferase
MLQWLQNPHVKKWWDSEISYTQESVKEKYIDYTKGYKKADGLQKPIQAYIICSEGHAVGYIQSYYAYDFPRGYDLIELPESLAAIDMFIGSEAYLSNGIGSKAIEAFLNHYVFPHYRYAFVDPEIENEAAIRSYEKAGFSVIKKIHNSFWMVACQPIVRLSTRDSIALEAVFRKCFLEGDKLWVFGSRADLNRKGGDLDLYIETTLSSIDEAASQKGKFIALLKEKIGDQKIDMVLNVINFPYKLPIYDVAKSEGIRFL